MKKVTILNTLIGFVAAITLFNGTAKADAASAQVAEAVQVVEALQAASSLQAAEAAVSKILGSNAVALMPAIRALYKGGSVDKSFDYAALKSFVSSNQLSTSALMSGVGELGQKQVSIASLGKTSSIVAYTKALATRQQQAQTQSSSSQETVLAVSDAEALDAYRTYSFSNERLQKRQAQCGTSRDAGCLAEAKGMGKIIVAASQKTCSTIGSALSNCSTVVNKTVNNFYANTLNMSKAGWFKSGSDLALRYAFGFAVFATALGHSNPTAIALGYDNIQEQAVVQGPEAYYGARAEMQKCDLGKGDNGTAAQAVLR